MFIRKFHAAVKANPKAQSTDQKEKDALLKQLIGRLLTKGEPLRQRCGVIAMKVKITLNKRKKKF